MNLPSHFVFVHGACLGGWCWYKIQCLLESIGHKVSCPDLSSAGIDPSNADTIFTFEEYNKPLRHLLDSLPLGEKVILIGHSAGGDNVTEAIQNSPNIIQAAVFVAATMRRNGNPSHLPPPDPTEDLFDYGYGEGPDKPPTSVIFKKEVRRLKLCQRSPLQDCTLVDMLLKPCPVRALRAPVFPEGKGSDKVPRVYIKTLDDNCASLETQDGMIKGWPPNEVYTIDSDHCPMLSNPLQFFGLLVKIAAKFGGHDEHEMVLLGNTQHLTNTLVKRNHMLPMLGSKRARM